MRLLSPEWLHRQTIDLKLGDWLREIGEHKGRTEMFGTHVLTAMESLRQVTAEHSAAAACRLERSEASVEQSNYQHLILELQESASKLPVEAGTINQINERLFSGSYLAASGFQSRESAGAVGELCSDYLKMESSTESLLLIGCFMSELLRIQPFASGNLRTAMLAAVWLLNRRGYSVGRYVSMERIMEKMNQDLMTGLDQATVNSDWPSFNIMPWWSCWLKAVLLGYRELSVRSEALSGKRGAKTDMVLALIASIQGDFSIRQIQQQVPECGIELIRKIIKEQKAAGNVKCIGRGPNSLWRKKRTRKARIV